MIFSIKSILDKYKNEPLYTIKKVEYTLYFLLLITLYAISVLFTSFFTVGFDVVMVFELLAFLISVVFIIFMINQGHLTAAINIFAVAGTLKTFSLLQSEFGLHLFIQASLVIFVVGAIHNKKYQLYTTILACYSILVYYSYKPFGTQLIQDPTVLISYRNSMIIGVAMYVFCVIYVSRLVDSEIIKTTQLEYLRNTDPLTDLRNRHAFNMFVESMDHESSSCLMILDLDHFKNINDTYGHNTGDQVLKTFSRLLMDFENETDKAFRIGGEEFALILTDCSKGEAEDTSNEIVRKCSDTNFDIDIVVTVSIGCRFIKGPWNKSHFPHIYKQADELLYKAKEDGRNQYKIN